MSVQQAMMLLFFLNNKPNKTKTDILMLQQCLMIVSNGSLRGR